MKRGGSKEQGGVPTHDNRRGGTKFTISGGVMNGREKTTSNTKPTTNKQEARGPLEKSNTPHLQKKKKKKKPNLQAGA